MIRYRVINGCPTAGSQTNSSMDQLQYAYSNLGNSAFGIASFSKSCCASWCWSSSSTSPLSVSEVEGAVGDRISSMSPPCRWLKHQIVWPLFSIFQPYQGDGSLSWSDRRFGCLELIFLSSTGCRHSVWVLGSSCLYGPIFSYPVWFLICAIWSEMHSRADYDLATQPYIASPDWNF